MALCTRLSPSAGASLRSVLRQPQQHRIQQLRKQSNASKTTQDASQPQKLQGNLTPPPPKAAANGPKSTTFIPIPIAGQRLFTTALQPITAPFRAYGRFQKRNPLRTQLIMSIVIYFIGDLSSQFVLRESTTPQAAVDEAVDPMVSDEKGSSNGFFADTYSPGRSVRAVIIGSISSIPSYHWFLFLGRSFNVGAPFPRQTRFVLSLCYKVVINQLIFTPIFNSYFFGMQSLLAFPLATPVSATLQDVEGATGASDTTAIVSGYVEKFFSQDNAVAAFVRVRDTVPISWWNSCKFWPAVTAFSFTFIAPQHRNVFAGCVAVGWQTYLNMVNQRAATAELDRAKQAQAA